MTVICPKCQEPKDMHHQVNNIPECKDCDQLQFVGKDEAICYPPNKTVNNNQINNIFRNIKIIIISFVLMFFGYVLFFTKIPWMKKLIYLDIGIVVIIITVVLNSVFSSKSQNKLK